MTDTSTDTEAVERLARRFDAPPYVPRWALDKAGPTLRALAAERDALRARAEAAEAKLREAALAYLALDGQAIEALERAAKAEAEADRLRDIVERTVAMIARGRTIDAHAERVAQEGGSGTPVMWAAEAYDELLADLDRDARAALTAPSRPDTGWRPTEAAPVGRVVLGRYPPHTDAPFADSGAWVVWQDAGGQWYGDHHSSWYGTERDAPLAWAELPPTAPSRPQEDGKC